MALKFTTTEEVLKNAGFDENANITTSEVELKAYAAEGEILSAIGTQYPLSFLNNAQYLGSPAEDFLKNLATEYAAAKLLYAQYKGVDVDYAAEAGRRIGTIKSELLKISNGSMKLFYADFSEVEKNEGAKTGITGEFPEKIITKDKIF